MAYDLGNASAPAPHPHEGPLHPRNKWKLGKTSALAGIAVAYGGPLISISFCDVDCDTRTLNLVFDGELLRGETVIVKSNGFEVPTNVVLVDGMVKI